MTKITKNYKNDKKMTKITKLQKITKNDKKLQKITKNYKKITKMTKWEYGACSFTSGNEHPQFNILSLLSVQSQMWVSTLVADL